MTFNIERLTDADLAKVHRAQRQKTTEWEIGQLHAWQISVADHSQRQEIEQAIAFQAGAA